MEQQNYEREIDIFKLVKRVFKRLGIMIKAGVVGAVVLGIFMILKNIGTYNDKEAMDYLRTKYEAELNTYEMQVEELKREIDNINTSIDRQEDYNINSVYMQMNPFDVQNGVLQYFVDTGYQINPEATYQNPDYTNSVLNAYATNVNNGGLWKYLQENLQAKMELRYLQEIVDVSVDYDNAMITINIKHKTVDECEEIMLLMKGCLKEYQETIDANIGDHDISLLTENIYATVDLGLEDKQKANLNKITDLNDALEEKEFELKELKKNGKPVSGELTFSGIVISGVKFAILGGVVGAFLAAAVICVMELVNTRIKDEYDVAFYLGMPVLAEIPTNKCDVKEVTKSKKKYKARFNQYGGV
ncbi:MAG: hypothetical protein IJW18_03070 [Lachnospiraceae bacterium]|nr:hypothetical protein [Lachnospiraceae bacterium]